jgi:hypothetical protein
MHTLEGLPMLDYYKALLAKADSKSAWLVIHEYFRLFEEKDPPEELLWFMLTTSLRSENEEIEARHRGDMIFFYEYSIILLKAVRLLSQEFKMEQPGEEEDADDSN